MKEETDQPKDNQVSSNLKDLSAVIFVTFNNIEYKIENQPQWTTFRSIIVEEGQRAREVALLWQNLTIGPFEELSHRTTSAKGASCKYSIIEYSENH